MNRFQVAVAALALAACADQPPESKEGEPERWGQTSAPSQGGGEVRVAPEGPREDHYSKALDLIKEKRWDAARAELLSSLRAAEPEKEGDIRRRLAEVETELLAQPPWPLLSLLADKTLQNRVVSVRGTYKDGGEVGRTTGYFWLETAQKTRIRCRYSRLSLEEKETILSLKPGVPLLVRGELKSAWGSDPNPYLDADLFRREKKP
ncbi:MAG: hypothetical protein AAB339_11400 [Elusimicrobiota bacterium]